ncbi:MAG: oxygen-independent coproporphyrinogen III oxidase [Bacteroidetes bacterium]|nr:oxygen-independent coproporphyrinogen III oxidase [Bacteroidota bacterium]
MNYESLSPLLNKYNVPVPRYTSYPTVPYWKEGIDAERWKTVIAKSMNDANGGEGISLYIHLPFCESLCTYCGCNKKITSNHSVEEDYMQAIIKEWGLYQSLINEKPLIRELHLGGGTPTFFSPANLERLLDAILKDCRIHPQHEFGFEGHPNNTTQEHLQTLYNIGFRRVSYGVQDHDATVQRVINRIQPFDNVKRAVENARAIGYTSVNFDLIYGLPLQTPETMKSTIEQSLSLSPDRIAFYSYAHVPWTSKAQRLFDEHDLPTADVKMQLYQLGKKMFTENGYTDIGMDHFALPQDDLYKAWKEGWLHRNFMGYTTQRTGTLLGLGVSSISDAGVAFTQNQKTIHDYYAVIESGNLAVTKGFFLSEEDVDFRKYILDISCQGKTIFKEKNRAELEQHSYPELEKLQQDGLIEWNENGVQVTPLGRNFIRNICKAFDLHLLRAEEAQQSKMFSKAI